jgi:hypothetical protein
MNRAPKCVFVADSVLQANFAIAWLEQHDILARAGNPYSEGILDLVASFPWEAARGARGIELWVDNPEQTDAAARLLTEWEWARVSKEAQALTSEGSIPVLCDKCGMVSLFPATLRGTCQDCPHCGAYVDVGHEEDQPLNQDAEERSRSDGIQRPPHVRPDSGE